ncbi:MAG: hypothetical protein M1838_003105 [Thelocarpon superellum]|nr:MAG: hypothetical protein M1838_003105 [Thelocarpon superellum]
MATAESEGKRQRLSSWPGPSHQPVHPPPAPPRVQHGLEPPARYAPHPMPTSAQTTYHESEQRELPDPMSHPPSYHGHDTSSSHPYAPPPPHHPPHPPASYGAGANLPAAAPPGGPHPYPGESAYPRSAGTPMKSRSPTDAHGPPPMRSLSVASGAANQHHMPSYAVEPASAPTYHDHPPNGVHHGLSMATHESLPPAPAASYASSPVSAGPRESFYLGTSSINGPLVTTFPPRRKAIRAAQACDQCRQRKAKCDEGRPSCGFCKDANMPCVYREVPPPKQDRTLLQILRKLDAIEARVQELSEGRWPTNVKEQPADHEEQTSRSESGQTEDMPPPRSPDAGPSSAPANDAEPGRALMALRSDDVAPVNSTAALLDQETTGELGELTIPMEHTTAAHKLLRWPSIRSLMTQITEDEHYVMRAEESRGILRLHGRGECNDIGDCGGPGGSSDAGGTESESSYPSPSNSAEALWGTGIPFARDPPRPAVESIGGLNADGTLKLDTPTLMRLLDSYFQNIHIMHPFLNKERTTRMVLDFGNKYGPPTDYQARSPFNVPSPYASVSARRDSPTLNKAAKRKRSTTNVGTPPGSTPAMPNGTTARPAPERSISTVLVLLVAALGKVCEHKEFLPGPAPEIPRPTSMVSPPAYMADPHTLRHSPVSSHSSSFTSIPSPQDPTVGASRRVAETGAPASATVVYPAVTNVDVIPGLAYYAAATGILGDLLGANELPHVQAGLLAGLYAGQLARVLESWKWIHYACTACQFLIRPLKLNNETNPVRKDLTLTAFWTCLQLESDILAELDLPPSGITRLEDTMPFPEIKSDDYIIGFYYLAQIGLRKLLNRVHTSLYRPEQGGKEQAAWSTLELAELDFQLTSWRDLLPPPLRWIDGEPPPRQINAARLRAKYYGARYVIHRPFLHHALHPVKPRGIPPDSPIGGPVSQAGSPNATSAAAGSDRRSSLAMAPPVNPTSTGSRAPPSAIDEKVMEACRNCVEAAIQSTQAFHGIPENHRPIVTNIFGTAHAQFGNLLVLSVASKSPLLRGLVPTKDFDRVLQRTVSFLDNLSPISPTLEFDNKILKSSILKGR